MSRLIVWRRRAKRKGATVRRKQEGFEASSVVKFILLTRSMGLVLEFLVVVVLVLGIRKAQESRDI